jgi:hypothetical protein
VLGPGTGSVNATIAVYWDGVRVGVAAGVELNHATGCEPDGTCLTDFFRIGGARFDVATPGNFSGVIDNLVHYNGAIGDRDALGSLGHVVGAIAPQCPCPLDHPVWVQPGTYCAAHIVGSEATNQVARINVGGNRFYPEHMTDGDPQTEWRGGPDETNASVMFDLGGLHELRNFTANITALLPQ